MRACHILSTNRFVMFYKNGSQEEAVRGERSKWVYFGGARKGLRARDAAHRFSLEVVMERERGRGEGKREKDEKICSFWQCDAMPDISLTSA
jgi:hypothetical protein